MRQASIADDSVVRAMLSNVTLKKSTTRSTITSIKLQASGRPTHRTNLGNHLIRLGKSAATMDNHVVTIPRKTQSYCSADTPA
jgi:hypothetical protein